MKITRKEVERWLLSHPHLRKRSLMYEATAEYLGGNMTADQIERAITVHRRLQQILPPDKKGVELEKDWRSAEGMKSLVEFAEESLGGRRVIIRNGVTYLDPRI